jgi:hypothetical protein
MFIAPWPLTFFVRHTADDVFRSARCSHDKKRYIRDWKILSARLILSRQVRKLGSFFASQQRKSTGHAHGRRKKTGLPQGDGMVVNSDRVRIIK